MLEKDKNIKKTYLWNTIASLLDSFQTVVMLVVLTRFGTDKDSSVFVMAFAVGNLLFNIGKFNVRNYQVTDEVGHAFGSYLRARCISVFLMLISIGIYLVYGYSFKNYDYEKIITILIICLYKMIDASEDVLHGWMQKMKHLDIAARIRAVRISSFMIFTVAIFIFSRNLILSSLISLLISFILDVFMNYIETKRIMNISMEGNWKEARKILCNCFPLLMTALMSYYLYNAPKYIIDGKISDKLQTQFNIVFMPVFVVVVFSNFIFNPNLKTLSELWVSDLTGFRKMIRRLTLIPVGIDIIGIIIGMSIGIPVLQFIYNVDLSMLRKEFLLVLISGGLVALISLYILVLTIMRKLYTMLICYSLGTLVMIFLGSFFLTNYGLWGMCLLYVLVLLGIFLLLFCNVTRIIRIKS